MTHIKMILKHHLCLSGLLGIIQSKKLDFEDIFCYPCNVSLSLISPNFDFKSVFFTQFWPRGLFPKLLEKALHCKAFYKKTSLLGFVTR